MWLWLYTIGGDSLCDESEELAAMVRYEKGLLGQYVCATFSTDLLRAPLAGVEPLIWLQAYTVKTDVSQTTVYSSRLLTTFAGFKVQLTDKVT